MGGREEGGREVSEGTRESNKEIDRGNHAITSLKMDEERREEYAAEPLYSGHP